VLICLFVFPPELLRDRLSSEQGNYNKICLILPYVITFIAYEVQIRFHLIAEKENGSVQSLLHMACFVTFIWNIIRCGVA
jgi:hypothetical protein